MERARWKSLRGFLRKGKDEERDLRLLGWTEKRIERGIKSMRRHVEASSVREWEVSTTVGCRSGKRDSVDQTIDVSSISWDLLSHLATVCHVWKSPQETCREEPSGYVCGSLLLSYIPSSTPSLRNSLYAHTLLKRKKKKKKRKEEETEKEKKKKKSVFDLTKTRHENH